jgi:GNAT superfamily N-acetyltransferase
VPLLQDASAGEEADIQLRQHRGGTSHPSKRHPCCPLDDRLADKKVAATCHHYAMSSITTDYVLVPEAPGLDDYLRLRRLAGLSPKTPAQGSGALSGSWAFCHIRIEGTDEIVGMGRVIGDGGWYFLIADMAVLPTHQRQGIGRRVIEHLIERVTIAVPDAYLTLMADSPGRRLYESVGFADALPESLGMVLAR